MRVTLWIGGLIHLKTRLTSINHVIYLHNKVITGQNTFPLSSVSAASARTSSISLIN